jgi:hypothetical protein
MPLFLATASPLSLLMMGFIVGSVLTLLMMFFFGNDNNKRD